MAARLGLPETVLATGFLGGAGLIEIGARLALGAQDTLVDWAVDVPATVWPLFARSRLGWSAWISRQWRCATP
ncbi:MAG TPA: hypothetical protein VIT65_22185 [Microlunatus sp.]